jgi:hypothetical protein
MRSNTAATPTLRDLADEWIDRWSEQHRSVSLAKLFEEYLETRSKDSQKTPAVLALHEGEDGQASRAQSLDADQGGNRGRLLETLAV